MFERLRAFGDTSKKKLILICLALHTETGKRIPPIHMVYNISSTQDPLIPEPFRTEGTLA